MEMMDPMRTKLWCLEAPWEVALPPYSSNIEGIGREGALKPEVGTDLLRIVRVLILVLHPRVRIAFV